MSQGGWSGWFERAIAQYGSVEAYYQAWKEYHAPLYAAVARVVPPPASLFEVGCGIGLSARALEELGYQVTGIERDSSVLSLCRSVSPLVYAVLGDETNIGPSDVVTCLGLVEHLDAKDRLPFVYSLAKWAPVVVLAIPSPEQLSLSAPEMREQPIWLEELAGLLSGVGMAVVEAFGWGSDDPDEPNPPVERCMSYCAIGRWR